MAVITLITDFGIDDEYVGVMKGVLLSFNAACTVVDISHAIPVQDTTCASLMLKSAYAYFPKGTIHVVVVDPGVGSQRRIVLIESLGYFFLVPDNGLAADIAGWANPGRIVCVENRELFLPDVSNTFHGRDIFAPIAGRLSTGALAGKETGKGYKHPFGRELLVKELKPFVFPEVTINENTIIGSIIHIDRFGNLITNIEGSHIKGFKDACFVRFNSRVIKGLSKTYAQIEKGKPLALIGSKGYLELSVNCGSAATFFSGKKGDSIIIEAK